MKMKTQLTLAAVVAAGLLASGCSQQMVAQPVTPAAAAETVVKTVVDCSKCAKPEAPKQQPAGHNHPAIPGCTKSVRHNHPTARGGAHSHKYSCQKAMPAPKPAPAPAPAPKQVGHVHPAIPGCTESIRHNHPSALGGSHKHRYSCKKEQMVAPTAPRVVGHVHPAIPGCTDSVRHNHPTARGGAHTHKYSCRRPATQNYQQMATPKMIKPKGTYKGSIKIDGMMKQYEQQ